MISLGKNDLFVGIPATDNITNIWNLVKIKVVNAVFVIFQKAVSEDLLMQIDSIAIVVPESIKMVSLTAFYPLRILVLMSLFGTHHPMGAFFPG